ncbi:MAG: hypothetical protein F6K11_34550 [Leptolyngbya sp. SIO3F4]|nr:hypothetical protein [Leptolyngbya sp. SIO3F4]
MATPTLTTAERNAAANAVVDLCDQGTGNPELRFGNTGLAAVYLTVQLDGTNAFGNASNGVCTITGTPSGTASATGTATDFGYFDRDGTALRSGVLDSPISLTSGNTYQLTTATYIQPAS